MGEQLDVSGACLSDEKLSAKSRYFVCSHRRWSDLLCSRRCLHDHTHQTLEKETSQHTPQLVKTIVKEIMKVESSKQIHFLASCAMTVDRKSHTQHLVAPEISTENPIIQEDAHRPPNQEEQREQRALELACEEERGNHGVSLAHGT